MEKISGRKEYEFEIRSGIDGLKGSKKSRVILITVIVAFVIIGCAISIFSFIYSISFLKTFTSSLLKEYATDYVYNYGRRNVTAH